MPQAYLLVEQDAVLGVHQQSRDGDHRVEQQAAVSDDVLGAEHLEGRAGKTCLGPKTTNKENKKGKQKIQNKTKQTLQNTKKMVLQCQVQSNAIQSKCVVDSERWL